VADFERAVDMFQAVLSRNPAWAPAWAGLGLAQWELFTMVMAPGDWGTQATSSINRALALDPDLPEALHTRALIAWQKDWDYAEAARCFEKALSIRPGYALAHSTYGEMLEEEGGLDAATRHHDRLAALDPFSPFIAPERMNLVGDRKGPSAFLEEGARLVRKEPDNDMIMNAMANGLLILGRYGEAARAYEAEIKVCGRDPGLVGRLGFCYAKEGRGPEARNLLQELEPSGRGYTPPGFARAYVLAGLGRHSEAYEALERDFSLRCNTVRMLAMQPPWRNLDGLFLDPRWPALKARIRQILMSPSGGH
jgi:tetratricopeptide (TPR) repeat protein